VLPIGLVEAVRAGVVGSSYCMLRSSSLEALSGMCIAIQRRNSGDPLTCGACLMRSRIAAHGGGVVDANAN
jgi:hypothetical protein